MIFIWSENLYLQGGVYTHQQIAVCGSCQLKTEAESVDVREQLSQFSKERR